jgi:hypothetical protein
VFFISVVIYVFTFNFVILSCMVLAGNYFPHEAGYFPGAHPPKRLMAEVDSANAPVAL